MPAGSALELPVPIAFHTFWVLHPKTFCPGGKLVLKNICPTEQVLGVTGPIEKGYVAGNDRKSGFPACLDRSILVVWLSNGIEENRQSKMK
jgi:hypothetical protein